MRVENVLSFFRYQPYKGIRAGTVCMYVALVALPVVNVYTVFVSKVCSAFSALMM